MNKPPCANWSLWKGPEVEGTNGLGVSTLFIRSLAKFNVGPEDDLSFLSHKSLCSRVWFCKEFTDWEMIRAISKFFDQVCIEVLPKNFDAVPKDIRESATIYLKVSTPLKNGDFVCVGPAFSDEAFEIGTGAKVNPEKYLGDTQIV
jgi:hypothetical protein